MGGLPRAAFWRHSDVCVFCAWNGCHRVLGVAVCAITVAVVVVAVVAVVAAVAVVVCAATVGASCHVVWSSHACVRVVPTSFPCVCCFSLVAERSRSFESCAAILAWYPCTTSSTPPPTCCTWSSSTWTRYARRAVFPLVSFQLF